MLSPHSPVRLIGRHLELLLIHNRGAIFGLDPQQFIPGFPVNGFFTVFMVIAIAGIIVYYQRLKKNEILLHWGLAFILPGAMGNLYDRIMHPAKGVIDFIKVDLGFWPLNPWPIFNLADSWVTIGLCVLVLSFVLEEVQKRNRPSVSGEEPLTTHGT